MSALRPLDALEQRVVGCLVEKELSTPDSYPLTLNALVAACNQTSNRDPVSHLTPVEVDATLLRLMADLLVWRDRGARVLRWKHGLDDKLGLRGPAAKAILAELMLRGAQTPGELRARTQRMHEFVQLGEVEEALGALAGRGLLEELPRQPGQKERRWRHLLGSGAVIEAMPPHRPREEGADDEGTPPRPARSGFSASATQAFALRPPEPGMPAEPARPPAGLAASPAPEADLRARVAALERRVEELAATVARLARGDDPS